MLNNDLTNIEHSENSEHNQEVVETVETVSNVISTVKKPGEHYAVKSPSRGGARPGAGRPKGSTALITSSSLLKAIDEQFKRPLEDIIAEGYYDAVMNGDKKSRIEYERMLLGKLVAEKSEITVNNPEENVENAKLSFQEQLAAITGLNSINKH